MSAYEELVGNVALCCDCSLTEARDAVALISRTLETVTPEMVVAWDGDMTCDEIRFPTSSEYASGSWLAMLRASPLASK